MNLTPIWLILFFSFSTLQAQSFWSQIQDEKSIQASAVERLIIPDHYEIYALNLEGLKGDLSSAPMTGAGKGIKLDLPVGNGQMETFEFFESPAMSPVLSAKYPHIKSYKGVAIDNPLHSAWIDYGSTEFRGIMNLGNERIFIDPYFDVADGNYLVYNSRDYVIDLPESQKTCGVEEHGTTDKNSAGHSHIITPDYPSSSKTRSASVPVTKTTYKFALASTARWTMSQGGTVDAVLERMNTAVNRLNSLFEKEMAMKLELVDNNDQLIFFPVGSGMTPETPYNDEDNGRPTLGQNTGVINSVIGTNNYDMGHVFNSSCADGIAGVAFLGAVCVQNKGGGLSCVGNSDLSNFMLTTTAHELGHQFTSGHTWGSCPENEEQFSRRHNCEPGSGSTIMSYFGLCNTDNLSGEETPYFHTCSLIPMTRFISQEEGSICGDRTPALNNITEVWILDEGGTTIPINTPFELRGEATDVDGDSLTYVWEQIDSESFAAPLGSPVGNAPAFRSFAPNDKKTRVFPTLSNVLSGVDNNEERLPTYSRDMNFSFVARDNNIEAGSSSWATISFEAAEEAGPFIVTGPNNFTTREANQELLIEWDVANTDGPQVDCQYVDIFFSADNAETFPWFLGTTLNDGSAVVRVPDFPTDDAKVKVKGMDNVFFNLTRSIIRLKEPTMASFNFSLDDYVHTICLTDSVDVTITGESFGGFAGDVTLEVVGGPSEAQTSFSINPMPITGSSVLTVDMSAVGIGGRFPIELRAIGTDADTVYRTLYLETEEVTLDNANLQEPAHQSMGLTELSEFRWSPATDADRYTIQVSTNLDFAPANIVHELEVGEQTSTEDLDIDLTSGTIYYWRVISINDCSGSDISNTFIFSGINNSQYDPLLINNEPLQVTIAGQEAISDPLLLTEDEDNTADELIYTIIQTPEKGILSNNGEAIIEGSTFAQSAIGNGLIQYQHLGTEMEQDFFRFLVEDGQGGWISITQYDINIVEDMPPDAVNDIDAIDNYFDVYPNPAQLLLNINQKQGTAGDWSLILVDMEGKELMTEQLESEHTLDISHISAGLYILYIENGEKRLSKKLSIIK